MITTLIALSLCLQFAEEAATIQVKHQLGEDVSDMEPREVVEAAQETPVYDIGLEQERVIDEFRTEWFLKCVEDKEDDAGK